MPWRPWSSAQLLSGPFRDGGQHLLLQARKAHLARVQGCQAVRAACVLPLDFSSLISGLEDGTFEDVEEVTEEVAAISRAAAERLANESETGSTFCSCYSMKLSWRSRTK